MPPAAAPPIIRCFLALLSLSSPAVAEELNVFAASSLTEAVKQAVAPFEKTTSHRVVFNFGASNDLARQIKAGAPADVFFSADAAQMDALVAGGLVRAQDRVDVLSNALVVVVPVTSGMRIAAASDLKGLGRLGLADPQAVPAGVYARRWLEAAGVWDAVKEKVVPTLNVRAALAAVESANVDAGVVYRTDAAISNKVKVAFTVPRDQAPAIVYSLAPIAASRKAATPDLVRALASARDVYAGHGFIVLPEK